MKQWQLKYAYLLAGCLMLAGAAWVILSQPAKPVVLQSEMFQPEKEHLAEILGEIKVVGFAGVPKTAQDSFAIALDFYSSARYEQAEQALAGYLKSHAGDLQALFYLGMTQLYQKNPKQAFATLAPLCNLPPFELQDDTRWYAALAAANVDQTQAIGLFARLSQDSSSKYHKAAEAVLNSLKSNPNDVRFQVEGGAGETSLNCSLLIQTQSAWWQDGWLRALIGFLFPLSGFGVIVWRRRIRQLVKENKVIEKERAQSELLLHNILPAETAAELKKFGHSDTRRYEMVTVLFCDFQEFTSISEKISAEELVASLGTCFEAYDRIMNANGLEKIKTVGDCYICAGGLAPKTARADVVEQSPGMQDAINVLHAAQEMLAFLTQFNAQQVQEGKPVFEARIGVHTGPVVAGIVGIKKYAYDIWGDTVNIAARMEQSSIAGRINISGSTYELVREHFPCLYRGKVEAKGKGAIDMYFVE